MLKYGVYIGYYDIGKENIQENDVEYIQKAEEYIQSILPYLSFDAYDKRIVNGDAGQNIFIYYEKDMPEEFENWSFM